MEGIKQKAQYTEATEEKTLNAGFKRVTEIFLIDLTQ
jgi:hypothetical protein